MSVYSSYNNRELLASHKAVLAAITRVQNDKRLTGRGNKLTILNKQFKSIKAVMVERGLAH